MICPSYGGDIRTRCKSFTTRTGEEEVRASYRCKKCGIDW